MDRLGRYLPILHWGRTYDRHALTSDAVAAVIVTIMLIPQSLAYAMLAGLPPEAVRLAEARTRRLNEAWDKFRQMRRGTVPEPAE